MKSMVRLFSLVFILSAVLLVSCNVGKRNVDSGYFLQNFDDLFYWHPGALVTSEKAHSGAYSTFVDKEHPFSQTFEMKLEHARYAGYKKFRVKGWCLKEMDGTRAGFVSTITHGDHTYASNSSDLSVSLPQTKSWGYCTFSMELPADAPGDAIIRVYLWTSNGSKAYLDDVEIIFKK